MKLKKYFPFLIFFLATAGVIDAFIVEKQFGIIPCFLCKYERYLLLAVSFFSFFYGFFRKSFLKASALVTNMFLIILTSYHIGLELKIFPPLEACLTLSQPSPSKELPVQERIKIMKERLSHNKNLVRCDVSNWKIFDVPATIWLMIFSLIILIFIILM